MTTTGRRLSRAIAVCSAGKSCSPKIMKWRGTPPFFGFPFDACVFESAWMHKEMRGAIIDGWMVLLRVSAYSMSLKSNQFIMALING